jgi:hypothetical protein
MAGFARELGGRARPRVVGTGVAFLVALSLDGVAPRTRGASLPPAGTPSMQS